MKSTNENNLKCVEEEEKEKEKDTEAGNKDEVDESSPLQTSEKTETENQNETKEKISFMERLRIIKRNMTVEPIMACYIIPSTISALAVQNLNLDKACLVNLNFSAEICEALNKRETENYTFYEEEVQALTTSIQQWKNVVQTVIPVLLMLFIGAWSDKTGCRKVCILMPILGELIACLGYILTTFFFLQLPAEVTGFVESVIPAIAGGSLANSIGVYSYIGDITTEDERTYRMGIVSLWNSLGYPIGSALSGILLRLIGYYGVFILCSCLYTLSLLYGYFYLQDAKRKVEEKTEGSKFMKFVKEFFDLSLVVDTFRLVYEKGTGSRRLKVLLLLVLICFVSGPVYGEYTVIYLFTRKQLNWNEVQYSMWSSYSTLTSLAGTTVSMSLFSSYLKMDDSILGIVSCASKVGASIAYAFANSDLGIYLAPLLEALYGTSSITMQSISSKLVSGDDFGKLSSLFGVAESMLPLIYVPVYSKVYMATLDVFPGAVFLMGAFLMVPAFIIFGFLYFKLKKDAKKEAENADAEEPNNDEKE